MFVTKRCLQTSLGLAALLSSLSAHAETPLSMPQCRAHIPERIKSGPVDPLAPYTIAADELHAKQGDKASFTGNVEFAQGPRVLKAENTVLDEQAQTLKATGEIEFQDNLVSVKSDTFDASLKDHKATLNSAEYQLFEQQGRGEAHNLTINGEQNLSLEEASYTACPPDDRSWEIRAEKIDIDSKEQWATTKNATVRLFDVPVMYLPYFSYPIGDQRHSGFLFPTISTSTKNGIDIATPYYWNIAPNLDATITPRLMTRRGLQLQTEFRYLKGQNNGTINAEYLANDDVINEDRYLIHWDHQGQYKRHWRFNTDYTQISDDNYFNDLGDKLGKVNENQLLQTGDVGYHTKNWYTQLLVQDFQVLGNTEQPHTLLPQLTFAGDWDLDWQTLQFGFDTEISNFTHSDNTVYTAQRVHLEPSLSLPYAVPAGFFQADLALMHTYYNQDKGNSSEYDYLATNVSRTLPKVSVQGGLNFDRKTRWYGDNYTQTLEPVIKYLYIPYTNQDDIGIYDTDNLQQDYYGLFRDQRYSGLDRIADANQITLGVHSRFLSPSNQETLRLSLGQIIYIEPSRTTLIPGSEPTNNSSSALAFEADANIQQDWYGHTGIQIDTLEGRINKANAAVEWRPEIQKLIQLNYRYSQASETMVSDVNQIGSKVAWPVTDSISAVGSYYRDMILDRSIESYLGVQYNSCCWGIRLTYQRGLQSTYVDDSSGVDRVGEFDTSLRLDFEIKGLGGSDTSSREQMLEGGNFKYGQPFYLNN
ncbi:LPS assembly protein LptD [Agarivorans sp. 1_MG-2023]|uniref:LPS assembly protein LptD n=1 Tax=Agarivorans sp. 1_MG-2023 TaxID=3062634 RepID=UPI0026E3F84C|nr:LPS assembly protein LptD [Agarivorans sp. 1_MG-2023]MDO6766039.1 LPS assembly protein LptD [Agarivorans sp. 1_MG-2023]